MHKVLNNANPKKFGKESCICFIITRKRVLNYARSSGMHLSHEMRSQCVMTTNHMKIEVELLAETSNIPNASQIQHPILEWC
jgi:hypothetical protein